MRYQTAPEAQTFLWARLPSKDRPPPGAHTCHRDPEYHGGAQASNTESRLVPCVYFSICNPDTISITQMSRWGTRYIFQINSVLKFQTQHKFKNFNYILLRMYPFDKIMLQEAFNALDINCTHYTKQENHKKKSRWAKPFRDKSYLNYTQLNEIFLRKIYKYFFFLCYSYTI